MTGLAGPIDAVTFDLDGTLYAQRSIGPRFFLANALRWSHIRAALAAREEVRGVAHEDGAAMRMAEARAIVARIGGTIEAAHALVDERIDDVLTRCLSPQKLVPGAREGIAALRARGVRVAVVTDRRVADKVAALGLADAFDALVSAEEHGGLKPDPRGVLLAAERLGVAPSRLVHVGDRADADVVAAHAAGAQAVLVSVRHPDPSSRAPALRTPTLRAAIDAIVDAALPPGGARGAP